MTTSSAPTGASLARGVPPTITAESLQALTHKTHGAIDALTAARAARELEVSAVKDSAKTLEASRVATMKDLLSQMDAFSEQMTKRFGEMVARIDALAPRIAALESRANAARNKTNDICGRMSRGYR